MSIDLPIPAAKLKPRSFKQRLLGDDHRQNYFLRARNAVAKGLLGEGEIEEIGRQYEGDLFVDFRSEWIEFLEEVLYHLLSDEVLDVEETRFVRAFVTELRVEREDAESAYQNAARKVFSERLYKEVGPLGPTEAQMRAFGGLAKRLRLSKADLAFDELVQPILDRHIEYMLADGLVTPGEWSNHLDLCRRCGVEPVLSADTQDQIDAAKRRWALENRPLQPIDAPGLRLKAKEEAFFDGRAEWYELRKVRVGPGESEDRYRLIARGRVVLTSDRILLMNDEGPNKSLGWNSILAVDRVGDREIECEKATGKSPVIQFLPKSAAGCVVTQRLHSGDVS